MGTGVEIAAKRYGADPRYQARACTRSPSLPLSPPPARTTRQAPPRRHAFSNRAYLSHTCTHYMHQAYLDATPLLFPTLASLRRTLSRG